MKRLICILIFGFMVMQNQVLLAHPPSKIILEFNAETSILKVEMVHAVKDGSKHFIHKVEVKLNGQEILTQELLSQQDTEKQTVTYLIRDAKSGDELEVTGYCNVFGKRKEMLQIP